MRGNAPGRFKALADNNLFVLETVTWTLMGRHGKPLDTERWWMPGRASFRTNSLIASTFAKPTANVERRK